MVNFSKSTVEEAALSWFGDSGYAVAPRENEDLDALRNTLLPKPLSSELRVSQAGKSMKETL